ncbi:MAG: FKBP-type peptidyl-prolyl cis-trans isomerase [Verrucomicrobiota bacterium]|nr:FKBP-type peptidyl-prolyl cis-trans isomerase [Verrucomicrobiota bacterium]
MKYISVVFIFAATVAFAVDAPKEQKDKVSYSIGVDIGQNLKRSEIEINTDLLKQGINDAVGGGTLLLTDADMQQTMQAFQTEIQAKMTKKRAEAGEKNKVEGEAFLATNKAKEGVKTTTSGLQYEVITEGKGEKPKSTDSVKTNYRGTLINGTEFDSSYKRNEPAVFPVTGVIPGWTEALQLMPVGSKWRLFVPSNLAYGENGPREIGPNSTLIFEVELLGVEQPKAETKTESETTIESAPSASPSASGSPVAKKKK